jgi:ubiquitin-protein ligase
MGGRRKEGSPQLSSGYKKVRTPHGTRHGTKVSETNAGHHTDLSELSLGSTMRTIFPDPDDTLNFTLTIEPDEGMYKDGTFNFSIAINQNFPHDAPKVKCKQKIYHPNIDLEGNVCLNILRGDWKPVLNLNAVFVGLQVRTFDLFNYRGDETRNKVVMLTGNGGYSFSSSNRMPRTR